MFIGVGLATFAVVWWGASPTVALAAGAAAGMAAMTRLVLTPILFGALLAGSAGIDAVPAAVLAAVAAWMMIRAIEQRPSPPASAVDAITDHVTLALPTQPTGPAARSRPGRPGGSIARPTVIHRVGRSATGSVLVGRGDGARMRIWYRGGGGGRWHWCASPSRSHPLPLISRTGSSPSLAAFGWHRSRWPAWLVPGDPWQPVRRRRMEPVEVGVRSGSRPGDHVRRSGLGLQRHPESRRRRHRHKDEHGGHDAPSNVALREHFSPLGRRRSTGYPPVGL